MMLADRTEAVLRVDARLTSLAEQLAAAKASKDWLRVALLRRRLDTVLETRLSETR